MNAFIKFAVVAATLVVGAASANAGIAIDATQGPITVTISGR